MFGATSHARLVLGCSVSAICIMSSFSAIAQTCVSFTSNGQVAIQGSTTSKLSILNGNVVATEVVDSSGTPVAGTPQVVTRAQPAAPKTFNLLGITGQTIANGMFMNAAAAGGGSTPSITTTEVSTDQALELIQRRRSQQAMATMISGAASNSALTTTSTASSQASAAPVASEKPKPRVTKEARPARRFAARRRVARYGLASETARAEKRTTPQVTKREHVPLYSERAFETYGGPAPQAVLPYSYKDNPGSGFGGADLLTNGAWAQGYGEYEYHSNLNPGAIDNPSRNQYTAGMMSGIDQTFRDADLLGEGSLQLGLLGGYNNTYTTFPGANQRDDGGFVGAYGTYSLNRFALDFLVKGDFYNHNQTAACPAGSQPVSTLGAQVLRELQGAPSSNSPSGFVVLPGAAVNAAGDIAENNLNILSNVYYRFDIGDGYWLEPTTGFRYSYTAYGDNAALFGLENGELWRIQGGARIGTNGIYNGYIWSASLLGLLYDDVSISGYVTEATALTSGPATVDQGKLRALGQLFGTMSDGLGWNYWALLEVRGGEDVFAVGGKLGIRYQW